MAYSLTLTHDEIAVFVWVGDRYGNGTKMLSAIEADSPHDYEGQNQFTFEISEPKAWEIKELAEEDDYLFPCFVTTLKEKLWQFIEKIV